MDSVYSDVYDLNINTGALSLKIKNFGHVTRWYPDVNGRVRAALVTNDNNKEFWFRSNEQDAFKKVIEYSVESYFIPYFDTKNTHLAYVLQNVFSDKLSVIQYHMKQNKTLKVVYENSKYDVHKVYFSNLKNKIQSVSYDDFFQQYKFFDSSQVIINKIFKDVLEDDFRYYLVESSKDERFKIFGVEKDNYMGGYYLYNSEENKIIHLSDYNPKFPLDNRKIFFTKDTISFINDNGFEIQGYCTLTHNFRQAPLVVFLHENVTQRDVMEFSKTVQFFANIGYNVYQLNYSGSSGIGKVFRELGNKQIDGNIYRDILQGITEVQKRYGLKNQKVVLYGKGMGGCIALQTASAAPQVITAVVANTAYLNLFSYVKGVSITNKSALPITYKRVGNPLEDTKYFKEVSPIFNVDKISVPVLVGYNMSDPLSSANEYLNYVRLMQNAHKDIYFFSTLTNHEIYDFDTYNVPFFENVAIFLSKIK